MKNAILAIVSLAVLGCQAQYKTMLHARITPTNSVVVDIPDWAKSDNPPVSEDGTLDYNALTNKPSINGTTIEGSLTTEDLGITAGASDYNDLTNKPSVNGVELSGNKTASDLGLATPDEALLAVYYPDGNVTSVDQITTEGLEYTYDDATRTATLSNGRSATGDIVIPWKVVKDGKEYKVTAVGENAFLDGYDGANISSVTAPTTVTSIGDGAFTACSSLTSVSFPSVTSIRSFNFHYCSSLTSVSLPSATSIADGAFHSCDAMTSVSLPSVTSIGENAFAFCSSLKSVDFGATPRDTIPTFVSDAFYAVLTTCKFIIPLGMYDEWIAADGWKDLYAAGYQFVGYADAAKMVKKSDLDNKLDKTKVVIPDASATAGQVADAKATYDSLHEVSDAALLAIYYPEGNVTSLDQITTEGLEYSYNDATLTATLTKGINAKGDVVIPWKVVKDGKEYKVTAVGDYAFTNNDEMIGAGISSVTSPTTVTSIGSTSFAFCMSLSSVSFPSAISIGNDAFSLCMSLSSISFPSATSIGGNAFYNCSSLTSISFPSVTSIRSYVFDYCDSLTSIDFGTTPRDTVPTLGGRAFSKVPTSCKFIIPLGMYDEWIAADGWKDLYAAGYKFTGYADAGDVDKSINEATADHVKSNDMASAIAPINNNVNVMWTYVFGERVWFAVTNYMRTVGGVVPSLQLFEVRDGQTNLVYWSAEEIDTRVGDKIDIAMSNIVDTVVTAKADRAWSKYQSMTGADNPQPNDVTIVSTPSVMLSGGYEWQRFVDTGAEVWVLKCNDLITLGADTNAYFRITDLEGETQFAIEKTASRLVDAVPTATGFTTDGNNYFKVTFSGNIQPTIYVSPELVSSFFIECNATENEHGLSCTWSHDAAANTYTATIAHNAGDGRPTKMFVYGKVLQEGSTVVKHTAPSSFDGGIIINGIQYSVGTATIDGNTVMTLNPVTRAVSE